MQAPQTEFDDAQWICIKKIKGRYTHDVIAFIPVCVGGRADRRPLGSPLDRRPPPGDLSRGIEMLQTVASMSSAF